jgi:N-acetyl-anhydromuramyl-L-alanine amidase AmpD
LNINFKQMANNRTSLKRNKIEYLVLHDTGNTSPTANAEMHYQYFNNAYRGASADFFVDDKQILQVNDYYKYYSWHVGDGGNAYGINNRNSIGIELCINSNSNYNTAFNKTIELTKHLMKTLNIPIERVVRHFDASRKNCPGTMASNNWQRWTEFKSKLGSTTQTTTPENESIKLQKDLAELGYVITVDGIIGPQTKGFVKDFQTVMGLPADGVYGADTKAKLNETISNERMAIIYRAVNLLSQTSKKGQDALIIDRHGWIKKATTDVGIYWFIRKVADYVS